jgi:N-acetylmuramoyl-L-alanine amidase
VKIVPITPSTMTWKQTAQAADVNVLARTIWGEARGEGIIGMTAVASVIMNRVGIDIWGDGKPDWWGEGIEGVCRAKWQFSCWNEGDPNRVLLEGLTSQDAMFREALTIARLAIEGVTADLTQAATHYKVSTWPWPRSWGPERIPHMVIGKHSFYKDMEPGVPDGPIRPVLEGAA